MAVHLPYFIPDKTTSGTQNPHGLFLRIYITFTFPVYCGALALRPTTCFSYITSLCGALTTCVGPQGHVNRTGKRQKINPVGDSDISLIHWQTHPSTYLPIILTVNTLCTRHATVRSGEFNGKRR